MSTGSIDYTSEEEIAAYLTNLSLEYRFGCYEEKSPKSCQLLGEFFESITRETEKAFQVFEANCIKNKFGPSCNKAGHQKILGISTNPDPDLGYRYLQDGCDAGYPKACYLAGEFHKLKLDQPIKTEQSLPKAAQYFDKACDMGLDKACQSYGSLFLSGKGGIEKDLSKAAEIFDKGCKLDNLGCCHNLAIMYKKGDGVEQCSEKAEQLMNKVQDIREKMEKEQQRIKFQEGVETAGNRPLQI